MTAAVPPPRAPREDGDGDPSVPPCRKPNPDTLTQLRPCPTCGATEGQPCNPLTLGRYRFHKSRTEAPGD